MSEATDTSEASNNGDDAVLQNLKEIQEAAQTTPQGARTESHIVANRVLSQMPKTNFPQGKGTCAMNVENTPT